MRYMKKLLGVAIGLTLMVGTAGAKEARTVEAKDGLSCSLKGAKVVSTQKVLGGATLTICTHGAGDPAMNGTEIVVDLQLGETRMTWRDVADVYQVKAVKRRKYPKGKFRVFLEVLEHHMPGDDVLTRRAGLTLRLERNKAGKLSRTLYVNAGR